MSNANKDQNTQFNIAPSVLVGKISDGTEYVLISRGKQGEEPQVWSTGDATQTQQLVDQFSRTMDRVTA